MNVNQSREYQNHIRKASKIFSHLVKNDDFVNKSLILIKKSKALISSLDKYRSESDL